MTYLEIGATYLLIGIVLTLLYMKKYHGPFRTYRFTKLDWVYVVLIGVMFWPGWVWGMLADIAEELWGGRKFPDI